jgi:hypothetical protein
MKRPPAFQFYPGDRLRELMPILADSEAVGAWCKAMMYLWDAGPSPAEVVASVAGKGWDRVGFLFAQKEGCLYLEWMEEKRAEMDQFRHRQAMNGKKGGRPKAASTKGKNPGLSSGKPTANPNESSPSLSPSPLLVVDEQLQVERQSLSMFDQPDADKLTTFRKSSVGTWEVFSQLPPIREADALNVDVRHYFEALMGWSDQNPRKKRTAAGWLSTVTGAMRRDKDAGKLRHRQDETKAQQQADDMLRYLQMGR